MQEKSTFVKLHRSITKWRWYQDANTFRVFVHLIIHANIKDRDFENLTIHRGQVVTSIAHLARDLKISIKSVRTALNHLKSTQEVAIETTSKFSIITIKNYNEYQMVAHASAQKGQATGTQRAIEGQQYKKEKNIKNIKNGKNEREEQITPKNTFGEFNNVFLTDTEVYNLKQRYPNDYVNKIEKLSAYIASTGKEYNSHYAVLLQWLAEDLAKAQQSGRGKSYGNRAVNSLQQERSYNLADIENMDYYDKYLDNLMRNKG